MKEFLDLLIEGNDTSSTFFFLLTYGMTQSNHFVSWSIKMMPFSWSYNAFPIRKGYLW